MMPKCLNQYVNTSSRSSIGLTESIFVRHVQCSQVRDAMTRHDGRIHIPVSASAFITLHQVIEECPVFSGIALSRD